VSTVGVISLYLFCGYRVCTNIEMVRIYSVREIIVFAGNFIHLHVN